MVYLSIDLSHVFFNLSPGLSLLKKFVVLFCKNVQFSFQFDCVKLCKRLEKKLSSKHRTE
jgi:hypothetical protein